MTEHVYSFEVFPKIWKSRSSWLQNIVLQNTVILQKHKALKYAISKYPSEYLLPLSFMMIGIADWYIVNCLNSLFSVLNISTPEKILIISVIKEICE